MSYLIRHMTGKSQKNQHFKEDMAQILTRQVEFPLGSFVTVVDARLSPDQANAKVVLSVMPVSYEEQVLDALHTFRHDIIKNMAVSLRLRQMPNLHWEFDHTEQNAEDLEKYMNKLKEKGDL